MNNSSPLQQIKAAHRRLFSLVTDPQGKRFTLAKTVEIRQMEMETALARTADFLDFLGRPQDRFPGILVTGTSGKGSVTMMLARLLRELGYRTAHHTSPYLQLPTEKLNIDGRRAAPADFAATVDRLLTTHEQWQANQSEYETLKYGEAWVALTFMWLAAQRPDWAVVEIGMGGRYDPNNLLPAELSIITNVAADHLKSLGPTVGDIAKHKAGIIKPGRPAVTAVTDPDLLAVLQAEADQKGSRLYTLGRDFSYAARPSHARGGLVTVHAPHRTYDRIPVGAGGRYQWANAAVAVTAVDLLCQPGPETELTALTDFQVPGRMEQVADDPITLLDGAHNPHKMAAFVLSLRAAYGDISITAVVGAIVNKELEGMLAELVPICDRLIATQPQVPGKPAVPADTIADLAHQLHPDLEIVQATAVADAVTLARKQTPADGLIVITGSLYLVGEAREHWYPTEQLAAADANR